MSSKIPSKEHPATCTLVIDNFSNCTTKETWFDPPNSSSFGLGMNADIDMRSTRYWKSKNVSFSLYSSDSMQVQYRMSIVNVNGQKCNTLDGKVKFGSLYRFRALYILNRDDILDPANGWLVNDTLTVYCEVYLIDSDLDDSTPPDESIIVSSMSHDYGSLFESGKLSDVVLVAGATEFKVHKTVLGARSPVFAAMFEHDTKEKQSNRIEVENVSGETYHELLRYIYTDKVENMKENALELMAAADKYQLEPLKSTCEQYLGSNLTTESVAITLVMADLHRAEALKMKCFEYICKNGRKVKATEGWNAIAAKIELITELFLHISDKHSED